MIAISQPTYFPWPGYFSLIKQSDHFVFLDDVQFDSRSWQQRNKILVNGKYFYLTIPVKKGFEIASYKRLWNTSNKFLNHLKTIKHNYSKAKYFNDFYFEIEKLNTQIVAQKTFWSKYFNYKKDFRNIEDKKISNHLTSAFKVKKLRN